MKREYRFGLVRRSPAFGLLFLAIAGSSFGTYVAAIVLTVDVNDRADVGLWVAALLIADFLPIVLIGLLLGPLVDRLSRRELMIVSDLVRFGCVRGLAVRGQPGRDRGARRRLRIATGFFRPAAYAGLPNLVPDDELTNANSLLQAVETLAWMIGPVVGALMYAAWGPSVPYVVNAVTFLVSAVLIAFISENKLRSEESLTRGHWRDVADGIRLVLTSAPLRTVLIVWNVVLLGSAAINVAEIFFARETLDAGTVGFGVLVAASGVGARARALPCRPCPRQGRAPASLRWLDNADGRGVGRGRVRELDLGRRTPRRRWRGRERGRDHLQPDPRPARRARPLPGASARDDHEYELRLARRRRWRGRRPHRPVRRARGVARGGRHLPLRSSGLARS